MLQAGNEFKVKEPWHCERDICEEK